VVHRKPFQKYVKLTISMPPISLWPHLLTPFAGYPNTRKSIAMPWPKFVVQVFCFSRVRMLWHTVRCGAHASSPGHRDWQLTHITRIGWRSIREIYDAIVAIFHAATIDANVNRRHTRTIGQWRKCLRLLLRFSLLISVLLFVLPVGHNLGPAATWGANVNALSSSCHEWWAGSESQQPGGNWISESPVKSIEPRWRGSAFGALPVLTRDERPEFGDND